MNNTPRASDSHPVRWFKPQPSTLRIGLFLALPAILLASLALFPQRASLQTPQHTKRSSSAIAISEDGSRLLVVNPDSNSVTLMDPTSGAALAELAVGDDPRTVALAGNDTALVANRGSGSVSLIDLSSLAVVAEIPVGQQPYGVVAAPEGELAFVANSGSDSISVMDTAARQVIATIPVRDRPAGLAITAQQLYVTHLLSGLVSVIDIGGLPDSVPYCGPWDADLDGQVSAGDVALIASAWNCTCGDPCYDPAGDTDGNCVVDISDIMPVAARWGPACPVISTGSTSNLAQSIVLNPAGDRAYLPLTRSNAFNPAPLFDTSIFPVVSVIDLAASRHLPTELISLDMVDVPVNMPFDAAFTPDGAQLWVLNAGSNDISVVDPARKLGLAHITVGANPRGIVLSANGATAYVNNTLDGTVSAIDTATFQVTETFTATELPLPPILLRGKQLFHTSARPDIARDQWISCASCHFDGEMDGRTWHLPGLGPRNTPSLLGVIQTYPINWQADMDESQDQEHFIRQFQAGSGLIADGDPYPGRGMFNVGRSLDLDALATFVDSLPMTLNAQAPSAAVERGRQVFQSADTGCANCHPAPLYADRRRHDVGTATAPDELAGPEMDTPTLRGLAHTAPYLHDGSAATLYDVLITANPTDQHGVTSHLTAAEIADLIAFLLALPY